MPHDDIVLYWHVGDSMTWLGTSMLRTVSGENTSVATLDTTEFS